MEKHLPIIACLLKPIGRFLAHNNLSVVPLALFVGENIFQTNNQTLYVSYFSGSTQRTFHLATISHPLCFRSLEISGGVQGGPEANRPLLLKYNTS